MTAEEHAQSLEDLAAALGVTRGYHDGTGRWRRASDEAVVAILRMLGAPVERVEDAAGALRALRETGRREAPPVVTAVAGEDGEIAMPRRGDGLHRASLVLEDSERIDVPAWNDGADSLRIRIPREAPAGYHRVVVDGPGGVEDTVLFVAPPRLPEAERGWGLFTPLYGIRRDHAAPASFATYGDLARVGNWMTSGHGAGGHGRDRAYLGTLPLLAGFFEEPFEPSPYSPVSRAFWSELYVDPCAAPEFAASTEARRLAETAAALPAATGAARERIDYRGAMRVRRAAIEAMLRGLDDGGPGGRRDAFERALETDDELVRYASFRAAVERHGSTWERWPDRARSGTLRAGVDYDGGAFRYHAYAQWLAREQVAAAAAASGAGLYLDLPLGCHGGGYDTWRHPGDFAAGASAGAPPDNVFEGGQNWAFPPVHPQHARRSAYASVRAALRHHFEHASLLRVDHVMGLHRLFWIPDGFDASDGVYVRSESRELWSILAIEAARARGGHGAAVVGEDLGTVPDEVRREMNSRGALRLHVVPFELREDAIAAPAADALTCLGTHDMEPFAAWWNAEDTPRERLASFLACETGAASALAALLAWMGASDAAVSFANLEDLWLETERQNLPGTASSHGNWQRPFVRSVESFTGDAAMGRLLDLVRGAGQAGSASSSREPR